MTTPRKILTLDEVSARTRIPVNTIRWQRSQGRPTVPMFRLGRRLVAFEDQVDAYLQAQYEADAQRKVGA